MIPDEYIRALEQHIIDLKDVLRPFIQHYDPDWMDDYPLDQFLASYSEHTFGQLREAVKQIERVVIRKA